MKLSTIKVVAGLSLLFAIAFGNGAAAAQRDLTPLRATGTANGGALVAVAAIGVGVFGFQRRKG